MVPGGQQLHQAATLPGGGMWARVLATNGVHFTEAVRTADLLRQCFRLWPWAASDRLCIACTGGAHPGARQASEADEQLQVYKCVLQWSHGCSVH